MARTHHPDITEAALFEFDCNVLSAVQTILHSDDIPNTSVVYLQLPIADGGFGLTSLHATRQHAFEASFEQFGPNGNEKATPQSVRVREVVDRALENIKASEDATLKARILSSAGPGSWLLYSQHVYCDDTWRIAAAMRLGLPIRREPNIVCRCGKKVATETFSDHVMACQHLVGVTSLHRHNAVQYAMENVLHAHGLPTAAVPVGYHSETAKRPDFLIITKRRTICVDVSVVQPVAPTYAREAANIAAAAARRKENDAIQVRRMTRCDGARRHAT